MTRNSSPDAERVVGRYMLHREIAAGGMATVHFGRLLGPVGFSRMVAIKRLHAHFARDPHFVSMLLDEARLAARIRHPNVVPILDVVATAGELFLVMEYVHGESFSHLIRASGPIPPAHAVAIVSSVLHGLHAAHEANGESGRPLRIVHRDVSPQNVIVGTDGVARVLDFGIAKAAGRVQTTRDGQLKGKLAYMAPEQLTGNAVTRQTDVFAAAVVLWEALAGRRLFLAENEAAVLASVLVRDVEPPSRHAPGIPPELDAAVLRGLDRDPKQRWVTAREMALAIERALRPSTASELGEWVAEVAAPALALRSKLLSGIESTSTMRSSVPDDGEQILDAMARSSEPSASLHLPPDRVAPTVPPPRAPPSPIERTLTAAEPADERLPLNRGISRSAAIGVALVALLAAGWLRRAATGGAALAAAASPPPAALPRQDDTRAAPPGPELPAEPEPGPGKVAVATARPAPVPRRPPHKPSCQPPYTVDESGIRHVKPECLE